MTSRSLIPRRGERERAGDLAREFGRFSSPVERLFDDLFGGAAFAPRLFRFEEPGAWNYVPNCDLSETDEHYVLRAEVPGFSREELHVDVAEGTVSLRGEKTRQEGAEGERYMCRESCRTSFERTFRLPEEVDVENVSAKLKEGVLTLTLPKAHAAHARQIEVTEDP